MAEGSKIEWTDHTFNPWIGCTKVSPACDHCYAEIERATKALHVVWGPGQRRHRTSAATWRDPRRWNAAHLEFFAAHGRRQRVFCSSLADWADNEVSVEWLADLLELVRTTPNLDWLMLTKRIGNVMKRLRAVLDYITADEALSALQAWIERWIAGEPPVNVWLGATVVNQHEANRDIPKLLLTPARKRFLSMEPLLGPVDLTRIEIDQQLTPTVPGRINALTTDDDDLYFQTPNALDWVIVGGESGSRARPMHPDWARVLRDQCERAGVPFLFKQWGGWMPVERTPDVESMITMPGQNKDVWAWPDGTKDGWCGGPVSVRVGKKSAGRLLDGRTYDEFPVEVAA
ncbi:phage Gp37/Gp68 family protein [Burkholderia multivorans]|uniref:phage Gp37/Gp68 family protein n=1 Tax=Burkholderia multivorans TaxID=87883 RepID=UPI00158B52B7|nr:phage Gp37/Gp68 family protein [Burkholderia multivorans]MDR8877280.1 hypothetical protein [Burkholderia multivorans]MDR8882460.1 hypothetical protein [Burkholderia multivorans]MDR8889479.1 hypothetical protein [Burkholderia multivorans]MDR8908233.1 hypothetical protein [Burkholderia multivorans]MDR8915112.1 hypothetical protein [Burkholderia multivorans]